MIADRNYFGLIIRIFSQYLQLDEDQVLEFYFHKSGVILHKPCLAGAGRTTQTAESRIIGGEMYKILVTFLLLLTSSIADAVIINAYNGNIKFDHKMHRSIFKCSECHDGPPRYIELNKQKAHKLCLGCHKREKRGPLQHCSDCHKLDVEE